MSAPTVVNVTHDTTAIAFAHDLTTPSGSIGDLIVAFLVWGTPSGANTATFPTGWTALGQTQTGTSPDGFVGVWYRVTDGTEGATIRVNTSQGTRVAYQLMRLSGYTAAPAINAYDTNQGFGGTSFDPASFTSGFGAIPTLWIPFLSHNENYLVTAYPSGYSDGLDQWTTFGPAALRLATARKVTTAASEDPGAFTIGGTGWFSGSTVAIPGSTAAAPIAAFSGAPTSVEREMQFTDESLNIPTSWAWTFGDGGTSTGQNPSHVYAAAGIYSVQLTATNAQGSDAITHTFEVVVTPPYVPPSPALALLEIFTNDPAAPRWDEANWDEANWGGSAWQDVTPEGVDVRIIWGSSRPELGILSVPDAANWYVTFYDPNRVLDPANAASPYYSDLRPGLPIRVTHRGIVIRTGNADVIGHSIRDRQSIVRGSDIISLMARADVPEASILAGNLYDRARDAISAAGLSIRVVPTDAGPALGAQLTRGSVWDHIKDAAQAVLYYPWVTRDNDLSFRPYTLPLERGRIIAAPNLVDLSSIVDTAGLVSVVDVQQTVADGGALIERAITPTPAFGIRIFTRSEETPDFDTWADTVLADRSVTGIRWIPGDLYCATADDVEDFGTLEGGELVSLTDLNAVPIIDTSALILGGSIEVTGRTDRSAQWVFTFQAANSAVISGAIPLTEDGGGATDYLTDESGTHYLYAG